MPFTDDDLKRLKEIAEFSSEPHFKHIIPALLARLEAAEFCARRLAVNPAKDFVDRQTLEAWRKAAGK